jgi:hypothetical protein
VGKGGREGKERKGRGGVKGGGGKEERVAPQSNFLATPLDVHQHIMESPLPLAGEEHELEVEQDDEQLSNTNPPACSGNCMSCLGCIMKMLVDYRYHCRTYNLYQCLKTALTLHSCERAFSKLKYVKSRLRSSLSQELGVGAPDDTQMARPTE